MTLQNLYGIYGYISYEIEHQNLNSKKKQDMIYVYYIYIYIIIYILNYNYIPLQRRSAVSMFAEQRMVRDPQKTRGPLYQSPLRNTHITHIKNHKSAGLQ